MTKMDLSFVSAADQKIGWEEATKSLVGKRRQFGNAFPAVLRGHWQSGLTGQRSVFYSTKPFDHRRQHATNVFLYFVF